MKKYLKIWLLALCVLTLAACEKKEKYNIEILVPAGSTESFVYSDEEIRPIGNKITIWSGAGLSDTEVILKPVNENVETGYVAEYLTHGAPVEFDSDHVKDEWFKIGVSVQNTSDKGPIAVSIEVEGVEVRIPEKAEGEASLVPSGDEENYGITLTIENITSTGATIKCEQSGGEATGEIQTGSWYIVERWTQADGWKEAETVLDKQQIGWTAEAYIIPEESTTEWKVNWEWLYGALPVGKYRIGKQIMDWRKPGDYDTEVYYVSFDIY